MHDKPPAHQSHVFNNGESAHQMGIHRKSISDPISLAPHFSDAYRAITISKSAELGA